MTDGAGATGDEHDLACQVACECHCPVRGHARDAEARTLDEARVVRQFRNEVCVERDVFSRGAEQAPAALAVVEPHAAPQPRGIDPVADFIDDAAAVAVGNDQRTFHGVGAPDAAVAVGGIHARSVQAHAHLAGRRMRRRLLAELHDFGRRTLACVPDGFHGWGMLALRHRSIRPTVKATGGACTACTFSS